MFTYDSMPTVFAFLTFLSYSSYLDCLVIFIVGFLRRWPNHRYFLHSSLCFSTLRRSGYLELVALLNQNYPRSDRYKLAIKESLILTRLGSTQSQLVGK